MTLASEVRAVRSSVGLSRASHITVVAVDGPDALELLQAASTQSPYVREGRVRHALLLREDASVFADVFIVKVEESFLVLAEGPDERALIAALEGAREHATSKQATVRAMHDEWVILGIDGPYAWEVISRLLGPSAVGMPYLTVLRREEMLCLRAGKTGEYGYLLLLPPRSNEEVQGKLLEMGAAFDLALVSREALDVCALENWHFSMRTLRETTLASPLTPVELQLQWRVVYARDFVGATALRARREQGARARTTCFTAERYVEPGQRVRLGELDVGEVLASCESPTLGLTVGSALLERRFAHPHLALLAESARGAIPLRTCTASLVDNVSLHVDPHKHSYATRNVPVAP